MEALFLDESRPVVVFDLPRPDVIALRLLTALWPSMHRRFALSTFAISPRNREAAPEGPRCTLDGEVLESQGRRRGKAQERDIAIPDFGYKNHASIDRRHGFIGGWNVTSASAYDGAQLRNVLNRGNTGSTVWADTA